MAIAQPADAPRHGRPNKTEMVKRHTDMMVQRYGLDDVQAQKLLALNTQYADVIGPKGGPGMRHGRHGRHLRPDSTQRHRPELTEEQRQEMRKKMDAYDAELKKIMTEDQYKKYKEDRKKHPRRPHGPKPRPQG